MSFVTDRSRGRLVPASCSLGRSFSRAPSQIFLPAWLLPRAPHRQLGVTSICFLCTLKTELTLSTAEKENKYEKTKPQVESKQKSYKNVDATREPNANAHGPMRGRAGLRDGHVLPRASVPLMPLRDSRLLMSALLPFGP